MISAGSDGLRNPGTYVLPALQNSQHPVVLLLSGILVLPRECNGIRVSVFVPVHTLTCVHGLHTCEVSER